MSEQKEVVVREVAPVRAKHYKVTLNAPSTDRPQILETIKAYIAAGMPLGHIANATEDLGYQVERGQTDAPLKPLTEKRAEIIENKSQIIAWHDRGEVVPLANRLSATPGSGQELEVSAQSLVVAAAGDEEVIEIIEGIAVVSEPEPEPQINSAPISELYTNPYLQALPDKKAA